MGGDLRYPPFSVSVHILHHGRCFDGAASAALFAVFARRTLGVRAPMRFIPKHHRRGDPFEPDDFDCDWAACVDFRYSQHPRLQWFFDHHRSAFTTPGDLEHFQADTSGQKFHDPDASSCAQMICDLTRDRFGFDPSPHQELIAWADHIDSASFRNATHAIDLSASPMKLATYIQSESNPDRIEQFIEDLLRVPLDTLANADYLQPLLRERQEQHQDNLQKIQHVGTLRDDVLVYDLLGEPPRILNHFIPYHLEPSIRYALGAYLHEDQSLRITVGFNPWHEGERTHDLASLCEPFGGGGHPYVAGCSFEPSEHKAARAALLGIYEQLHPPRGNPTHG